MKEQIQFTDREQFLISFYRDSRLSSWRRGAAIDGIYVAVSLSFVGFYLKNEDLALGLFGYTILVWRVVCSIWSTRLYSSAFRAIFRKYDEKIKELSSENKHQED